ncbi:MAG: metal-sensitive transcriptional regulator [Firmicutes bacterium]|nr:metal-sensitive transcriptional regulator [Bacillota bacterium]
MEKVIRDPKAIKSLVARLRRIEGQARGIQRMIEEGRPCEEVVTQLSALKNAVDKVATHVILENLERCILDESPEMDPREALQEAKRLILRL